VKALVKDRSSRFRRSAGAGPKVGKVQFSPLIVGYELFDRGILSIFAWIDVAAVDSTNGIRISMHPTVLIFRMSNN
jgi:hypothetical protein